MPSLIRSNTGASGWTNSQQFTTSGNFTVPAGVTKVGVRMIGGGGSVTSGTADSGKFLEVEAMAVTPGATMPVVVGAAGASANAGGASTFGGRVAAGGIGGIEMVETMPGYGVGIGAFGRGSRLGANVPAQPGVVEIYW